MTLSVPGVGDVPVVWMPASDEDYKDASEGGRSGYQPIAIVHHRAVTSLAGLDRTFAASDADKATVGSPGRSVSSHFGIGYKGGWQIHQYVNLADTAYTNGDCRADTHPAEPSRWDGWYGHRGHNERVVTIEHDDQGGSADPLKRGVVREPIIKISIALDRLMLSGDRDAMKAAGIHIREDATAAALGKIVPGPTTLIDHNDIAGRNKPYCWRPWQADTIGFPRARYIAELTPRAYTQAELDAAVKAATGPLKATIATQAASLLAQGTELAATRTNLEALAAKIAAATKALA